MKTRSITRKSICAATAMFFLLSLNAQSIDESRFGASAASWAGSEGWSNFQDLGIHYMRLPIDLQKNVIVDNFFLTQYDNYVDTGQNYDIIMYGIVNPKKNVSDQYPTVIEFYNNLKTIVEHYDGDGYNDMSGLIYPIKNWEICNEITWGTLCDSDPNCQWKYFGRYNYLIFMDTARAAVKSACPSCNLFNGAQVDPPSVSIQGQGFSTLIELIDSLGTNIIDAISYHNYNYFLQSDTSMQDFASYGVANKTIWVTEADMQNEYNFNPALTQDDNPRLCIPSFVYAFYKGFDKIIYTSMRAATSDPAFVQWGSLREPQTGAKRKIYFAYKKLIEKIDYFTDVVAASPNNNSTIFAYNFTVQNKPVYVLWATSPQTVTLSLTSDSVTSVTATAGIPQDTLGNFTLQNIPASGGSVSLNLSDIPVYVEENITIGIREDTRNSSLLIYPNPFSETTTIEITNGKDENFELKIYDVFGKELRKYDIRNQKNEISAGDIPGGLYFIRLSQGNTTIAIEKLIICH